VRDRVSMAMSPSSMSGWATPAARRIKAPKRAEVEPAPFIGPCVPSRQHDVQHDRIVRIVLRLEQSVLVRLRCVHRVALFAQSLRQAPQQAGFIFGNQDPQLNASALSRRNRYRDVPSMTVGVLSEMLRPVPVLLRNPDCEGGDILTIWLRQATRPFTTLIRYSLSRKIRPIPDYSCVGT
jgi:hypothetical protein